ncbi:MAG TPA: 23S rRNA (pseudouridine(1915)-N(3))-methyltransferase RlmH [Chitinophagales bacterium]|nr:23S rRNA (pseudouridine(1915)-N(3))-methyltransferase RlmH [Chitinophagales bacterium]
MKIRIITISQSKEPAATDLFSNYIKRLKHYCILETIALKSSNQKEEAAAVLKKISTDEELILLDETGKEFSSREFSSWLQKKLNGSKNLCFVIGSAYGFDESLKKKCSMMMTLSQMTLPHQLAKVLFAEQLYRAFTILRNEKYHH